MSDIERDHHKHHRNINKIENNTSKKAEKSGRQNALDERPWKRLAEGWIEGA